MGLSVDPGGIHRQGLHPAVGRRIGCRVPYYQRGLVLDRVVGGGDGGQIRRCESDFRAGTIGECAWTKDVDGGHTWACVGAYERMYTPKGRT